MPVYNAASHIQEAIESVLNQTYRNWELLVVNDGSTDDSEKIIRENADERIRYLFQDNGGVSSARNAGLRLMRGAYFCFLDADDVMPPKSIESRIGAFQNNENLSFVDGIVLRKDKNLEKTISFYTPKFKGNPQSELLRLSSSCFLGNSWMVRRNFQHSYSFNEELTHLEDFLFFLEISKHGDYDYVKEEILWYRRGNNTAMRDLQGLENGYKYISNYVKRNSLATGLQFCFLKYKIARVMFLSNLFLDKKPRQALKSLFNFFR